MKKCSAQVELEQHAQAKTFDEPDQTLLLSRELAIKLNPQRPDFNGALILYGLYLWQRTRIPAFSYVPMVGDKRGCYRSLSELQEQYPWLSEEGIRQILERAEGAFAKDFLIDRKNENALRGKLHFHLSPGLIKRYGFDRGPAKEWETAKGALALSKVDATRHGVLEAVLAELPKRTEALHGLLDVAVGLN